MARIPSLPEKYISRSLCMPPPQDEIEDVFMAIRWLAIVYIYVPASTHSMATSNGFRGDSQFGCQKTRIVSGRY